MRYSALKTLFALVITIYEYTFDIPIDQSNNYPVLINNAQYNIENINNNIENIDNNSDINNDMYD